MFDKLISFIKLLMKEKFTGSIEVHFSEGGIAKIIKHEKVN